MSVKKEASGRRSVQVEVEVPGTPEEVWQAIATGPGISSWFMPAAFEERLSVGQRCSGPEGAPALSGVAEYVTQSPYDALLRIDKPGPGVAALGASSFPGGPTMVAMNVYLYGDQAAGTVARETPLWQVWMQERFPMPTELTKSE